MVVVVLFRGRGEDAVGRLVYGGEHKIKELDEPFWYRYYRQLTKKKGEHVLDAALILLGVFAVELSVCKAKCPLVFVEVLMDRRKFLEVGVVNIR